LKILELQIIKELNQTMGMLTNNQKQQKKTITMELKKKPRKKNSFGSFRKIQEKEDHGFKGTAKKKKTTLGTLEKP